MRAIVTEAARGLGAALVHQLADRGYDVDEDTNSENQLVMTVKWSAVQKGDMGGTI